jgi:uncharacterized protein YuzB (UPF0349 family)
MAFYRISGAPNVQPMNGAASTVLSANGLVTMVSGALAKSSSTSSVISGVVLETRATTDSDYATAKPVLVDMLSPSCLVFCDNVTGTLAATMEGQFMKLSSTAGLVADAGTATDTPAAALVLMLVKFISPTSGYFMVNGLKQERPAA